MNNLETSGSINKSGNPRRHVMLTAVFSDPDFPPDYVIGEGIAEYDGEEWNSTKCVSCGRREVVAAFFQWDDAAMAAEIMQAFGGEADVAG